jgi:hypothetical protein
MKKLSRNLLAALLIAILFVTSLAMQLSICAHRTIFNDQFYLTFANKNNLYNISQNYVLLTIKDKVELDAETYKGLLAAAKTVYSEEWTEQQFSLLLNNFLGYIKGDYNVLNLSIDFTEKNSQFINELVNNIDLQLLGINIVSDDYKLYMAEYLNKSSGIPDYVDLTYNNVFNRSQMLQYINWIRTYYPYTVTLPYLFFGVFFIIMLIIFKPARTLKNTGYALVASGMALIIFISYISGVLDHIITSHLTVYDELQALIGSRPKLLIAVFKNSVLAASNKTAILFCISGLITYLIGYLVSRKQRKLHRSFLGFK